MQLGMRKTVRKLDYLPLNFSVSACGVKFEPLTLMPTTWFYRSGLALTMLPAKRIYQYQVSLT